MSAREMLASGVCKYKGLLVTTNRELLEKYYGVSNLYKRLEIGIERKRLCLDELLSSKLKYHIGWYCYKYRLFYDCDTINQFIDELKSDTEWGKESSTIKARVLSRDLQHTSYYVDIPKTAEITLVEDVTKLMPKEYVYYAISENFGYCSCRVKAGSVSLAKEYGYAEFNRCYGSTSKYMGLKLNDKVIDGICIDSINIDKQRQLCQYLMWGYVKQFDNYTKVLREIASELNLSITDEHVKYLFVNNLARVTKDPNLVDVGYCLAVFLDSCINGKVDELLNKEYMKLSLGVIQKGIQQLYANPSLIVNEKTTVYTSDNTFVMFDTPNKVLGDVADVTYNGKHIGRINIKPYKG